MAIPVPGCYLKGSLECYNITRGQQQIQWNVKNRGEKKKCRHFPSALLPGLGTTRFLTAGEPTRQCGIKHEVACDTSSGKQLGYSPSPTTTSLPLISSFMALSLLPSSHAGLKRCNVLDPCTSTEEPFTGTTWIQKTMDSPSTETEETTHRSSTTSCYQER